MYICIIFILILERATLLWTFLPQSLKYALNQAYFEYKSPDTHNMVKE